MISGRELVNRFLQRWFRFGQVESTPVAEDKHEAELVAVYSAGRHLEDNSATLVFRPPTQAN